MKDFEITIALPDEVEKTFSAKLKNKEELITLIAAADGKKAEFEELVFTAKYIMGLLRASDNPGNQSGEVVKKEIGESIIKVQDIMSEIAGEHFEKFAEKYFRPDPAALQHLTTLLADLELIKLYLNDLKRKS